MLILTTNRVTTLDSAFKSRIHLGIKYQPLSITTRRELWQTFIAKAGDSDNCEWLDDSVLTDLASYQFNGRMIKNAVRMAHALAIDEEIELGPSHLKKAVEAMNMFEQDMAQAEENDEERAALQASANAELDSANPRKRRRIDI